MKKMYLFALLALISLTFSCGENDDNGGGSGNVTETPKIPETPTQATALVNAIYGPLQTLSSSYSFFLENATETTVCFETPDTDGPQISRFSTNDRNGYVVKIFNRLYSSINAANTAIYLIEQADATKVSTPDNPAYGTKGVSAAELIARARFIRGYDYFQLVQFFGEVPIITTYPTPSAVEKTTRKSIDEVYTQAIADLTDAIADLPEYSASKYVPTQLAAKTILAKALLTWGSKPLTASEINPAATTDPAKPAVDAAKFEQALAYANEVINSGNYNLRPDFNTIWGVGNENNPEVIFSIQHYGDGVDAQGNHQTHCGYTWPKDEREDPHIQWADISYENALADKDARKLYSYATYVSFADGNIDTLTWPLSVVRPGKWIHRDGTGTTNTLDNQPNDIDHIDFRLAEVYLIKAEAQFYLNSGDRGLAAINALRTRAKIPTLSVISEDALRQEWQNELAFEQKHWLNLVRWRTLISTVKTKVPTYEYYKDEYKTQEQFNSIVYNDIPADPARFSFYTRINEHLHDKVNNVSLKFYRFPIPATADDKTTSLNIKPQNPGF
ncbi:MAG: RagB/SusD family nutrient uptake outer membrane protein [Dysgonamonadaceae bacterium]|nr:RagB/SusD family nutrient uptake outer membrane protein [Dysgonamonadaceae bacterium]